MLTPPRTSWICRRAALTAGRIVALALLLLCRPSLGSAQDSVDGLFVTVANPITSSAVSQVKDQTKRAVQKHRLSGAENRPLTIVYDFNPEGKPASTREFAPANDLATFLLDQSQVRTVAFVHTETTQHTVLPVLACQELVMSSKATLGDVCGEEDAKRTLSPSEREEYRKTARRRPPAAILKMLDPDMELVKAQNSDGLAWVVDPHQPIPEGITVTGTTPVVGAGPTTTLFTTDQALALRLCTTKKETREQVAEAYGLSAQSQPEEAEPGWVDAIAGFLRHPLTRLVLVMLGIVCLIVELKVPGVTAPGVIAAFCFVLFFWSHAQSAGIDVLALLLFLLGLILLGLEVFVVPGWGVTGVSGVVALVLSLSLAALQKHPQSGAEWSNLLGLAAQFGLGLIVAVLLGILLASYLPQIPFLNRLVLKPPGETAEGHEETAAQPPHPARADLLAAIGVAATPLRPAGKVRFGEEYVDVVAECGYVEPGTRVQVVEIEGNRIVVKEVV
jgi:membrane-bound serine protease (ClpP class)